MVKVKNKEREFKLKVNERELLVILKAVNNLHTLAHSDRLTQEQLAKIPLPVTWIEDVSYDIVDTLNNIQGILHIKNKYADDFKNID